MKKSLITLFIIIILTTLLGCAKERPETPGYTPSYAGVRGTYHGRNTPMSEDDATLIMNNSVNSLENITLTNTDLYVDKVYDGSELLKVSLNSKDSGSQFMYNDINYLNLEISKPSPCEINASVTFKFNIDNLKNNYIKFEETLAQTLFINIRGEEQTLYKYNGTLESILKYIDKGILDDYETENNYDNTHVKILNKINTNDMNLTMTFKRTTK